MKHAAEAAENVREHAVVIRNVAIHFNRIL
jgi:hypothetical protein